MPHLSKPIQTWASLQSNSPCHCLWLSNGIWANHKGQLTGRYTKWIFSLLPTHQCEAPCCNAENLLCKKNTASFSTWLQVRRFWLGFMVHFKKKYSYKIAQSKLDQGLCYIITLSSVCGFRQTFFFENTPLPIFQIRLKAVKCSLAKITWKLMNIS